MSKDELRLTVTVEQNPVSRERKLEAALRRFMNEADKVNGGPNFRYAVEQGNKVLNSTGPENCGFSVDQVLDDLMTNLRANIENKRDVLGGSGMPLEAALDLVLKDLKPLFNLTMKKMGV